MLTFPFYDQLNLDLRKTFQYKNDGSVWVLLPVKINLDLDLRKTFQYRNDESVWVQKLHNSYSINPPQYQGVIS